MEELTNTEKIGQMLIVGMDSNHITERIKILIQTYKVGGVILYRKNFNTYPEMLAMVSALKTLNLVNKIPLFIAIDQEGGRVNRMPREFSKLINAKEIAETKEEMLVERSGRVIGKMLKESGFNMNFAPVLDIQRFEDSHAIGNRCYGKNVEDVCKYGIQMMKKEKDEGILPVIKHFPGHGATKKDSHYLLPVIKSIHQLEQEDMIPFGQAIEEGADAVMVSHLMIRDISRIYPVSLSRKFIYQYLRKKYHYRGLIITDDLKMRAIRYIYGPKLAVKKAFEAGNDMIIFRFHNHEEKNAIEHIIQLVNKGKIKISRINRSVKRIIQMKDKYQITDHEMPLGCEIEKINKEIEDINRLVRK